MISLVLIGALTVAGAAAALWSAWGGGPAASLAAGACVLGVGAGAGVLAARARAARRQGEAAAARLQARDKEYRQLMEKALAGMFIYRDERIVYMNERLKRLVGDDAVGRSFWGYVHPEDQAKVQALVAQRQAEGAKDLDYECRILGREGKVSWMQVVSSEVDYEGRPAILVSVYDITARKEVEEKRRELSTLAMRQEEQLVHSTRLAEMGEMAAGVAHELNQPLTGIKTFARNSLYMLEEGLGGLDEVKENLAMISGQVDRASRIIHQMRELARRTERHQAPVDINNTLRESVEFVMPQLRLTGIDVVFSLAPDLPPVQGDRIRLEQVFLNLLTNARHAMEETAQRSLRVTTRHEAGAAWPVVIEIADTGTGFTPEVKEKLFTPFFSTKKAPRGTGLGLSISLGIVKDHLGSIEASGAAGRGAVFTVRLPAAPPDAAAEAEPGAPRARGEAS